MVRLQPILRVRRARELDALVSPGRMELVDCLQALGPATIAEIGASLARKPASLYYHVHRLVAAGLVRVKAKRSGARRPEVVYELAAQAISVEGSLRSRRAARALTRAAAALLRRAAREYSRALEAWNDAGPERTPILFAARMNGPLPPASAQRVTRHVLAIQRIFQGARVAGRGRPFALTALMCPLDCDAPRRPAARRRG